MIRLTDLRDKEVRTLDGDKLGRVHEVHCEKGKLVALMVGAASIIERLTAKDHGRGIPWDCVRKVEDDRIIVALDSPKRKKPSATQNRPRTRPPSGRRSAR